MLKKYSFLMMGLMVLNGMAISNASADFPYLKVNVIDFKDSSASDVQRVDGAAELIEQVVNSNEFRDRILNMTYRYSKTGKVYEGFTQNSNTREEILETIIKGQENFSGGSEGVIDFFLDMYYSRGRVIGYTSKTDKYIHMNRRFHRNYTSAQASANLFHEWLHKVGFGHSQRNNRDRPHSVPYKLGYLMGDMASAIASNGDPIAQAEFRSEFMKTLNEPCDD